MKKIAVGEADSPGVRQAPKMSFPDMRGHRHQVRIRGEALPGKRPWEQGSQAVYIYVQGKAMRT